MYSVPTVAISRVHIAQIEHGYVKMPGRDRLHALVAALGMTVEAFERHRVFKYSPQEVPVYSGFPLGKDNGSELVCYMNVSLPAGLDTQPRGLRAFSFSGKAGLPYVKDGDVAVIAPEAGLMLGNTVVYLSGGMAHAGKLVRVKGALVVRRGRDSRPLEACRPAARVLQVIRNI